MARKLSSLFFSTIKRAARLQRQALGLAAAPAARKARKKATKKVAKRAVKKASSPAASRSRATPADARMSPGGKGVWQNLIHATVSTSTELLGRLSYSLYRPTDTPLAGLPLLIMLHGCQQTPAEMAQGTRMNQLADQKGFVVAYPQQARRVQHLRCWRWFEPDAGRGLAEADAIASLARALVRKHGLDATRVYVAGLSAGAGMAALAVLRHPELFAAAALHSGAVAGAAHDGASGLRVMRRGAAGEPAELLAPLSGAPAAGVPVMILHGMRDRVVSVRNAMQLAQQFSAWNGVAQGPRTVLGQGTHREYVRQDSVRGGRPVLRLCLLKEVGHGWSGGDARFKFHSEKGPAASVLIWQFLAMHRQAPLC